LAVGGGLREVMRERLCVCVDVAERFECLTELAVQAHPPCRAELPVDRLAYQGVREGVVAVPGLGQQPCGDGFVQRVEGARMLAEHTF
jgi:hypothetical protein